MTFFPLLADCLGALPGKPALTRQLLDVHFSSFRYASGLCPPISGAVQAGAYKLQPVTNS